jgi:hypothetical protein
VSHGFVASLGSGSPNVSFVPSGKMALVTFFPDRSACLIARAIDGLRLRGAGLVRRSGGSKRAN